MPHLGVGDRVKETTTTTGTGTINLDGAESGFQTFVDGIGNGHETYYVIVDSGTGDYEVGVGTITDATPDTLSRDTVISSSNAGALVNFGAGSKDVFCSLPSERAVIIDDASNVEVTANITATAFDGSGAALTALNASNVSSGTLDDARLTGNVVLTSGATFTGNVSLGDSDYLRLGDSQDLLIYHDASDSVIRDAGTGNLVLASTNLRMSTADRTESYIQADANGEVRLYYDNAEKLNTSVTGVTITGTASATTFSGSGASLTTLNASNVSSGTLDNARLSGDVVLTSGATFTGNVDLGDSVYINLGAADDLQIVHNHTTGVSSVTDTQIGGTLNLEADTVRLTGTANINSAYTLPTSDGTSGQVLTTNGSGALTFQTPTVGDITGVTAGSGLTGGGTSGDVTLNVGAGTGVTVNADDIAIGQDVATSASPTFAGATFTANVSLGDNDYLRLGASNDLLIYHNGSSSIIRDFGTGNLFIGGSTQVKITNDAINEDMAVFNHNGSVELYYDASKKFETTSGGIDVTGTITFDGGTTSADLNFGDSDKAVFGADSDLQIYHSGTDNESYILENGVGNLFIGGDANIVMTNAAFTETKALFATNGSVDLYYDNSKKFETTSGGVTVTGTVTSDGISIGDNDLINVGTGNDLQIVHDGSNSYINDNGTGNLIITANNSTIIKCQVTGVPDETSASFNLNGSVDLYYDNVKKFETTSTGIAVTGGATFTANVSLGDQDYLRLGASSDLILFHDGGNSVIRDQGTGNLFIDASTTLTFRSGASGESYCVMNHNGSVDLYYDNSKKLETTSAGVTVTGTLTETSSIEYKENVQPLEFNEAIYNVNAVKYDRKDGSQKDEVGVIAEDLYEILPDLVQTKDGKPESVKYTKLTMYLLEALKKQNEEIQELKKRLN